MRQIIKFIAIFSVCLFAAGRLLAAEQGTIVKGQVTDKDGTPLAGVTVRADECPGAALTDADGFYSITVPDGAKQLLFYLPGYRSERMAVADARDRVALGLAETFDLEETVYMGHTAQRKGDISGSVASVSGQELAKSPTSNLSMALAGRLQGLLMQETYSEPSRANTGMYVRGISSIRANQPIVVIDGMVISYNMLQTFDYISAEEIESVTVLKDAASLALYGIQGADGVLVITTRRGRQGDLKIGVRLDQTFQQMTTKPAFINSAEYASLRNEAAFNDGLGENYYYSDEQITAFRTGSDRSLYPDNDWRDMFLKNVSSMQRLGVDISGGSDKVLYYTNVNLMHQGGFYNTDQDEYKSNSNFIWANVRSNVDLKVNRFLSASLRLAGNIKRERTPGGGFLADIYPLLYSVPSSVYGPTVPAVDPVTGEPVEGGGGVVVTDKIQTTPYGQINRSGFVRHTVTNIYAQFALNADLSFITPGLKAGGSFGYRTNSVNSLSTYQSYEKWIRSEDGTFSKYGNDINGNLTYGKSSSMYYQLDYRGMLSYDRQFGRHKAGAVAYLFYQDLSTEDKAMPGLLPYRKLVSGFEANYNFDDRYLLKFDVGYSGSEQYARARRFVATPAFSAAWVASNEAFLKDVSWLSHLKFRVAWGQTATERSGLGRYAYLDNVTLVGGGTIPAFSNTVTETQVGSPDIEPEISEKFNFGVDLSLFDNLSLSFELFRDRMDNMVIPGAATTPSYQGVPLGYLPATNSGEFESKGYEVSLRYSKAFRNGLKINVGGWLTYTENKVIRSGETEKNADYAYRKWQEGFPYGQEFGYLLDRSNGSPFYNTPEELAQSGLTYEFGTPRVGDLKYVDLNKDGIINERDKAPIGTGAIPRVYYAFFAEAKYKSFDLSLLFQGVGKYSTTFSGAGIYEYDYDGVFGSLHRNAWTEERARSGARIDYPALSTKKNTNHETSEFFLYDRSYLRLKNIELGYTLPRKWAAAISAENLRVSFSVQNPFTWDNMKSSDFGPEGSFLSVPVYRFYSVKLSLNF